MISGFYAYKADRAIITRRTRRVVRIMLCAVAIYAIFRLLNMVRHYELYGAFTALGVMRSVIRLVILSDFDFIWGGPLWFLMSLVEAYIMLLAVRKYGLMKAAYVYILFAVIASGVIYALSNDDWHFSSNVFMSGFRWVMAGHYIAENLSSISRISRKTLYASAIAGYLIGLLSLTGRFLFVSSVGFNLFPAALFILAVREDSQAVKFPPSIVKIGAEYSLYVYISHTLVNSVYAFVLKRLGVPDDISLVMWTRPVIVCALSIVVSFVIVKARDKISRKKSG